MRQFHACPGIKMIAGIGGTFIKSHDDVSANDALNIDHIFRGKNVPAAINVALKVYTLFIYFSICRKGKDLVAAAIG